MRTTEKMLIAGWLAFLVDGEGLFNVGMMIHDQSAVKTGVLSHDLVREQRSVGAANLCACRIDDGTFLFFMAQTFRHAHLYRSDAVAAEEQREIRQRVQQMLKHPDQVKAFLIKGGFITKSGKLAKRYRD